MLLKGFRFTATFAHLRMTFSLLVWIQMKVGTDQILVKSCNNKFTVTTGESIHIEFQNCLTDCLSEDLHAG